MKWSLAGFILTLIVKLRSLSLADGGAQVFRKVQVSNATLMKSGDPELSEGCSGLSRTFCCSRECGLYHWCQLWCQDPSTNGCLLSKVFVMPTYVENNTADALTCYTRRPKDLATNAIIQAVAVYQGSIFKVKENLVDGIYDPDRGLSYRTAISLDYPWILLDFELPVEITVVRVWMQQRGDIAQVNDFANMEMKLGMAPVDVLGDFSSYNLVASFAGPATEYGQVIPFKVPTPTKARFLSLQKNGVGTSFQIAHIEVY